MSIDKKYYAFISYKREDEAWAKWLQNKLEHYKLPSNLNGRSDLPKDIRPVFRDQSDLAGGVLAEEINKALENSQYLIVICSQRAAQSQWVGKEVQTFIEMGRTDKIIPFIVGGEPHSENLEEECLPLSLRKLPKEQELLGVNINEMGRDAAAVKVIARMFGLRFDELWQRHEREQRRKRFVIIAAALLLALVGVGVAVGFSRQNKRISEQNDKIVLQNEEISKKSNEVSKQNAEITKKNERLRNDSLIMAAQLDSINHRDALIKKQQDSISSTNKNLATANRSLESANKNLETAKGNLETTNEQLEQERDNLAKTIWKMKEKESKIMAKEIMALADEDSYLAQKLALEFLPKDVNNPIDRPYTPEAEQALRNICDKDNVVFKHPNNVDFTSFCQDENKVLSVAGNTITVINSFDGTVILKRDFERINCVDLSIDKKKIAITNDSLIQIMEIETGNISQTIDANSVINNVALSNNGDKVLSLSEDSVLRVWNGKTGDKLFEKRGVFNDIWIKDKILTFSPDGKQFVYVVSKTTQDENDYYASYEYSKDLLKRRRAINTFYVVDSETGKVLNKWNGHYDEILSLAYSPDGKKIVSTSYDRDIIVWDANTGKKLKTMKWKKGSVAKSASFSYDGENIVTAHTSGYIKVWESNTGNEVLSWKGHKQTVNTVALNSDKSVLISCSLDATLKIWDLEKRENRKILARILNLGEAYINNDNIVFYVTERTSKHSTLGTFSVEEGQEFVLVKNVPSDKGYLYINGIVDDVVLSRDGKYFAIITNEFNADGFNIYDTKTKEVVCTLKGHEDVIDYVCFSPDGKRIVTFSSDYTSRIWNLETGDEIKQFDIPMMSAEYSPDMKKMAVMYYSANIINIIDAKTYNSISVFNDHTTPVCWLKFSPEGNVASSDANENVKIWDVKTGEVLHSVKGDLSASNSGFSQDGKRLVTKIDNNTLKVWDLDSDGCIYTIESDNDSYIYHYVITPDGNHVIAICGDGLVCQWDFPPLQDLIDQTRERFKNRPLTDEERKMYYLE